MWQTLSWILTYRNSSSMLTISECKLRKKMMVQKPFRSQANGGKSWTPCLLSVVSSGRILLVTAHATKFLPQSLWRLVGWKRSYSIMWKSESWSRSVGPLVPWSPSPLCRNWVFRGPTVKDHDSLFHIIEVMLSVFDTNITVQFSVQNIKGRCFSFSRTSRSRCPKCVNESNTPSLWSLQDVHPLSPIVSISPNTLSHVCSI